MDSYSPCPTTTPRLLPALQQALAILYALPSSSSSTTTTGAASSGSPAFLDSSSAAASSSQQQQQQQRLAHDFLLQLQTRNLRRRIQSLQQKHRDKQQQQQQQLEDGNDMSDAAHLPGMPQDDSTLAKATTTTTVSSSSSSWTGDDLPMGSSWLALLVLLVMMTSTSCPEQPPQPPPPQQITTSSFSLSFFAACWTERLFCAQSLLQRLRRSKLVEAIDWEMEQPEEGQLLHYYYYYYYSAASSTTSASSSSLQQQHRQHQQYCCCVAAYQQLLTRCNPFAAAVLDTAKATKMISFQQQQQQQEQQQHASVLGGSSSVDDVLEALIKAEFGLWTLVAVAFQTAMMEQAPSSNDDDNNHNHKEPHHNPTTNEGGTGGGPLLETLGFAIATITLRIWYNARQQQQQQQQQQRSLVDMILDTFQTVWNVANNNSSNSNSSTSVVTFMAWLASLHATLAALPDVVLGSPGGARGRLSMDPQALYDAGQELRRSSSSSSNCNNNNYIAGSSFAAVMSCWTCTIQQQLSSSSSSSLRTTLHCHLWTLQTWEQWAKFLPLPMEFLEQSLPLVNHYQKAASASSLDNSNNNNSNHATLLERQCQVAAVAYLHAIFEGGTWNVEQILASTCGMTQNQLVQQAGKKKQTSRSKRRQEQVLQSRTTHASIQAAEREVWHRGQVACRAVLGTHEGLHANFQIAMAQAAAAATAITGGAVTNTAILVQGEGPIGCLAMAAQACMPHLLRACIVAEKAQPTTTTTTVSDATNLFQSLAHVFQSICASPHPSARVLSLEPLYALHACLVRLVVVEPEPHAQQKLLETSIGTVLVDHFFICCMSLASSCGYPDNYFDNLTVISDEELEIYRNDIRDLLRTVTCSLEDGGNKSSVRSSTGHGCCPINPLVTERILHKMLSACAESIQTHTIPPETAVHALSALAKPLNSLAKSLAATRTAASNGTTETPMTTSSPLVLETLSLALKSVLWTATSIVKAFHQQQPATPMQVLLPLSRTLNMAVASFAPMFSALCSADELSEAVAQVLTVSIQVAILSLRHIPELASQSIKEHSLYDIRGTMRGPGGEDHVGSLALMRLVFESDILALAVAHAAVPHVSQLCEVYQYLKVSESERGEAILFGAVPTTTICTTPKSRRILLSALSRVELMAQGTLGASTMLTDMFHAAITSVCALNPQQHERGKELYYYSLCETVFDIAAFSSSIVRSLFEQAGDMMCTQCLERLTSAVLDGYKIAASTQSEPNDTIFQWNRLRAAMFALLKSCASPDLPCRAVDVIQALVTAECQGIHEQFVAAGPRNVTSAMSVIFHSHVMGCEENTGVPAGLFVKSVNDAMEVSASDRPPPMTSSLNNGEVQEIHSLGKQPLAVSCPLSNCIEALYRCRSSVLSIVLLDFPAPVHDDDVDPRCTIAEAWLIAMVNLVKVYKLRKGRNNNDDARAEEILVDSFVAGVVLLFYPSLNKTRCNDPGMSLDGPQGLALLNFFTIFLELGPTTATTSSNGGSMGLLERVAVQIATRTPAVTGIATTDASAHVGLALIGAAFFRAVQGSMPPWAVESVPSLYSALFVALDSDSSMFGLVLRDAMEIRLSNVQNQRQHQQFIVGVIPGQLFSGRFFENMPTTAKDSFLQQTVELAHTSNWKKLKQSIKAACGGKKKETDFQQKPAFTKWDFDRI